MPNNKRRIPPIHLRDESLRSIQQAINDIVRNVNKSEDERDVQFEAFSRRINKPEEEKYFVTRSAVDVGLPSDSEGGNVNYDEAYIDFFVSRENADDSELFKVDFVDGALRFDVFSLEVISATNITAVVNASGDGNDNGRVDFSSITADEAFVTIDVLLGSGRIERHVVRVYKDKAVREYYIELALGDVIRNSTGNVTAQLKFRDGILDQNVTSGNIFIYDNTPQRCTNANGYGTGSDGYYVLVEAGDVDEELVLRIYDEDNTKYIGQPVTIKDISDTYQITMTNKDVTIKNNAYGIVSYENSVTDIRVYKNGIEMDSVSGTPGDGEFSVSAVGTNITIGSETVTGNPSSWGVASAMTTNYAYITYTINLENRFSVEEVQNFVRTGNGAPPPLVSIGYDTRVNAGAPSAYREWALVDGVDHDPSTFGDVDSIKLFRDDKNQDRFSWYYKMLADTVSTQNPLFIEVWKSDSENVLYVCTSATYSSNVIDFTVAYMSGTTYDSGDSITSNIAVSPTTVNIDIRFSIGYGEYNLDGVDFGLKDDDANTISGWSASNSFPVEETDATDTNVAPLETTFMDVFFIDEFGDTYTFSGTAEATADVGEYSIKNINTQRGSETESVSSSQARLTLDDVAGLERKGFYANTTFDLYVYWNGQEKYVGTFTISWVPDFIPVPIAEIVLDSGHSGLALSGASSLPVPYGEVVYSKNAKYQFSTYNNNRGEILVEVDHDGMTFDIEYSFNNSGFSPVTVAIELWRDRGGSLTKLAELTALETGESGTWTPSTQDVQANDRYYVVMTNEHATIATNITWTGDQKLRIELN